MINSSHYGPGDWEGWQWSSPDKPLSILGAFLEVFVDGKEVIFLLDTGFNVTIMPEACFKRLFGDHEPGNERDLNWLKWKTANGLAIPHVGYVLAEVQMGDITLKDMGIVMTIIIQMHCLF